jgi:hypothetical protein
MTRTSELVGKHLRKIPHLQTVLYSVRRFGKRVGKFVLCGVFRRYVVLKLVKACSERMETVRIQTSCRNNSLGHVLVVFDLLASPPNFGVLYYICMLARYFVVQGKCVDFVVVAGEYRADWSLLNEQEKTELLRKFLELPRVLLGSGWGGTVQVLPWNRLRQMVDECEVAGGTFIPFRGRVLKRQPVYTHAYNVLCRLVYRSDNGLRDRFLVSLQDVTAGVQAKMPQRPYVTWHVRYSTKWRQYDNCGDAEFVSIQRKLRELYKEHSIVVISDEIGCDYFGKLSRAYDLDLEFSKDLSSTFMGDCALILGSDYYFALRGGGISVCALYSKVPYSLICPITEASEWSQHKLTSWATDEQYFAAAADGSPRDFRS